MHASLAQPIELGDVPTFASASIGISLDDDRTTSAEALLSDADAAMYRAKAAGRNRSELFDASMRHAIVEQLEIGSRLRDAIENGEIVMHYQAIVDPITHLATGYEALVRWNHPDKGLLGPGAFLPAAEEAGLMDLVDAFALTTVCRRIADWSARFPVARNLYITTNWSARNLGRFVQQVEQVLESTAINPRQLVIEVTEGFLLEDTESSLQSLQRLKALGVQIAIDDFGTGYSSLSYLTRLAVDFLKIDKSFIDKIPADAASVAVVGAIADMATRLGIGLVAEGVETDEQLDVLRSLGSPRLQGYRFAKPRPADDIERQLELRSVIEVRGTGQPAGAGRRRIALRRARGLRGSPDGRSTGAVPARSTRVDRPGSFGPMRPTRAPPVVSTQGPRHRWPDMTSTRNRRWRSATIAGAAVTAVLLAGCSGDTADENRSAEPVTSVPGPAVGLAADIPALAGVRGPVRCAVDGHDRHLRRCDRRPLGARPSLHPGG